jgi:hypothetical protein
MNINWVLVGDNEAAFKSGLVWCEGSPTHDEADVDPGSPRFVSLRVVGGVPIKWDLLKESCVVETA